MPAEVINLHGDRRVEAGHGHGVDIASQRADDLDAAALALIHDYLHSGRRPRAADLGCGQAAQALRMAQAGAEVVALDLYPSFLDAVTRVRHEALGVGFVIGDLREADLYIGSGYHIVVCQRTIHYLPFADACRALMAVRRAMQPGGVLFISASGIDSELGAGYEGRAIPLAGRHVALAHDMAAKHNIAGPVCLYSERDLGLLLQCCGLVPDRIFRSTFGNIKAAAHRA